MEKLYPELISLELTTRCNLNCLMCAIANDDGSYIYGNLDEEMFANLKGALSKINVLALNGHGESLMHPRFLEIMAEMGKAVHRLVLTSNALLITDEVAKTLVRSRLAELTISIHAADPDIYAEISRKGKLDTLIRNVSLLNKYKEMYDTPLPTLIFQFVSMKRNIGQLEKLLSLAHELHIGKIIILKLQEYELVHGESLDRYPDLVREYLPPALKQARDLGIEMVVPPDYIRMLVPESMPEAIAPVCAEAPAISSDKQKMVRDCLDPWITVFITTDGEVYPCCNIRESIGSLKKSSFESIWFGVRLLQLQRSILSGNAPKQCRHCSHRGMTTLAALKRSVALRRARKAGYLLRDVYERLISIRLVRAIKKGLSL